MFSFRPLTILILLFLIAFVSIFIYNLYRFEDHAYDMDEEHIPIEQAGN